MPPALFQEMSSADCRHVPRGHRVSHSEHLLPLRDATRRHTVHGQPHRRTARDKKSVRATSRTHLSAGHRPGTRRRRHRADAPSRVSCRLFFVTRPPMPRHRTPPPAPCPSCPRRKRLSTIVHLPCGHAFFACCLHEYVSSRSLHFVCPACDDPPSIAAKIQVADNRIMQRRASVSM